MTCRKQPKIACTHKRFTTSFVYSEKIIKSKIFINITIVKKLFPVFNSSGLANIKAILVNYVYHSSYFFNRYNKSVVMLRLIWCYVSRSKLYCASLVAWWGIQWVYCQAQFTSLLSVLEIRDRVSSASLIGKFLPQKLFTVLVNQIKITL